MRTGVPTKHRSGVSVVVVALLTLLVACDKNAKGADSGAQTHPLIGVAAPEFELEAQSGGERMVLAEYRGKVVIVDFWATWCEPCKDSFPVYQALVDEKAGRLVVLAVSVDEEPDNIAAFAKQTGAKFLAAWDEDQGVSAQYRPESMPTSYVIDQNGIVRFVHSGFRAGDEQRLRAEVDELLSH